MKNIQLKQLPNPLIPYKNQIQQSTIQSYLLTFFQDKHIENIQSQFLSSTGIVDSKEIPNPTKSEQAYYLLAQIDFANIGLDYPFPNIGILQFFVNQSFGKEGSKRHEETFFVRYIPTSNTSDFNKTNQSYTHDCFFNNTKAFTGIKVLEPVSAFDYRFESYFTNVDEVISEDEQTFFDLYMKHFLGAEHKIGGYPYFIEEDFRKNNHSLRHFDTLLLQVVTDDSIHFEYRDSGVISFFINSDKLANKDFSDIYLHTEHY